MSSEETDKETVVRLIVIKSVDDRYYVGELSKEDDRYFYLQIGSAYVCWLSTHYKENWHPIKETRFSKNSYYEFRDAKIIELWKSLPGV